MSNSSNIPDTNNGCITDGDDHVYLGDKTVLKGGGRWQDLEEGYLLWDPQPVQTDLKRKRESSLDEVRAPPSLDAGLDLAP
jgi:hypothetical protein